jgi:hypothetical protein
LFFVDDVILIGKNREAAERLLHIMEKGIRKLGMEINYSKTKYLEFTPNDKDPLVSKVFQNENSKVQYELNYKYLGVEFHLTGRQSIFQEFYRTRLARAKSYAGSIKGLAAKSHDPVEVAEILWLKTAMPSILYGCEVASFTKKSIEDLESVQAQMGAFIIGVSNSSAHVGICMELGWPSIRSRIFERKIKYFHRLTNLADNLLVKKVLNECLEVNRPSPLVILLGKDQKNNWNSKYEREIMDIIECCKIPTLNPGKEGRITIKDQISAWEQSNVKLLQADKTSLKWQPKEFMIRGKQLYIDGSKEAHTIAQFRLGNAIPQREKIEKKCDLCNDSCGNNESHLVFSCSETESLRISLGLKDWISEMNLEKHSSDIILRKYLGDDGQMMKNRLLQRGAVLQKFILKREDVLLKLC